MLHPFFTFGKGKGEKTLEKEAWRKELLRRRMALPPAFRRRVGRLVALRLLSLPEVQLARVVGLYADFRGEVPTARLALLLCRAGKTLAFPAVIPWEKRLVFRCVRDRRDLVVGTYGIREPRPDVPSIARRALDVVVVPGVGFDRRGYRLGYGAGYYDRFLRTVRPDCFKVGLAYACQMVPVLPAEAHDLRLDAVVTEEGVFRFQE
ncbi:MAG: 5-formyltetrahydrofolate cyclo-ligase [Firmicutes bacterium]|nr:5-formyltetrahydrofolate cyclo-ligase [Bacillota bacterium]